MAGIEEYSNLMYANEDEDQLDDVSARYAYETINPQVGSDTSYRYVNSDRDLTLPLVKHRNIQSFYDSPEDGNLKIVGANVHINVAVDPVDISIRKYLSVSVGIVSLITENLLSHPFVVLRRQCQVHHSSQKYHLQPFTLIPTLIHLHQRQGVTTLWKGLGSCLLVRGMSLAVEDVITKITPWPKEVNNKTSMKKFGQHILLKCISIAVVMPFYSASLVETVQSDIASEKPGIFDVFREGAGRLLSWSVPQKGRMLPVWAIVGPSVSLGITKYTFSLIMKGISSRVMRYKWSDAQEQKGAKPRDLTAINQDIEIYSTLVSVVTSEILFYPLETILHRIQLQGTRTIIDNLDNGYAVVPILTSYEGAIDCYRTTIASEGIAGLYKGFGAILLQFAAHIAVIKIAKWVMFQVTDIMSSKPPSKIVEYYQLDRSSGFDGMGVGGANISNSTTASRSLSSLSGIE